METYLINALNKHNIELPTKAIEANGFTRWGHNSRYWLLPVGDGYVFGDWSQDTKEFAFPGGRDTLSVIERMRVHELIQAEREHRQEEVQAKQNAVAQTVQRQFDNSIPATPDFPYLSSKCIQSHCAKQNPDTGTLIIPLYDIDGVMWSVQYITPEGTKRFVPGGRKKGCFCPIGTPTDTIYLCEGFATAATVFEATGKYAVAAMDAGNLRHVAGALRQKYPMAQIIIAADNDWEKETNTGVESANAAAHEWGLSVIIPQITDSGLTDFNDIAVRYGIDMVREQLCPTDWLELKARDYGFKIYSAGDFLAYPLPPTEFLLYP
ncbi:MAG: toprim domain-containing protein, partial [Alphaproteobacteria bacterium]|nr:toprim domain-containing protein [Alphaproteobacteria bacterium]